MSDDNATRSRFVRQIILDVLSAADGAGSRFGLTWDQLRGGFRRSRTSVSDSELRRELNDLRDDRLIVETWDEDLGCDEYRLAARGRDFKRAGCPWPKIDEFTGNQP